MVIKSRDIIFEEGQGHHTISDVPTTVDVAFDDDSVPVSSHNTNTTPSGVVVSPKPLAPHARITDPPLHPEIMTPIMPNALSIPHNDPATAQPLAIP